MSLLDANPSSKDYYTVRITTINKKTGVRQYKYSAPVLLDGMSAMQLGSKYRQSVPGATVENELFVYDYGRHAWLPIPGFSR